MSAPRASLPIGLGDMIRAAAELRASDPELATIAALLGRRIPESKSSSTLDRRRHRRAMARALSGEDEASAAVTTGGPVPRTAQSDASALARDATELELVVVGTEPPPARAWIEDATDLPGPAAEALPYRSTVPPFEPLLAPVITRAVLATAAATSASDGPIDLDRLIGEVALRHPISALPRLPATTLRRGAQILIDRAVAMQPFQLDADDLAARLQRVASQGATQLLYFDEDPGTVDDTWPVGDGRLHELPAPGTPVILITDLGIRGLRPHRAHAQPFWWALVARAQRRRCPVMAFVPYPVSRWPTRLSSYITPLMWDRTTTVATIRAARRTGSR